MKRKDGAAVNWRKMDKAPAEGWPRWVEDREIVTSRKITLQPYDEDLGLDTLCFPVPKHLNLQIAYQIGMEPPAIKKADELHEYIPKVMLLDEQNNIRYEATIPVFDRGSAIKCQRCIASDPQRQCFHISWSPPNLSTGEYPRIDSTGKAEDVLLDACLECMISGDEGSCTNVGRIVCDEGELDHRVKLHLRPPPRSLIEALDLPARYSVVPIHTGRKRTTGRTSASGIAVKRIAEEQVKDGPNKRRALDGLASGSAHQGCTTDRDVASKASSINGNPAGGYPRDNIPDAMTRLGKADVHRFAKAGDNGAAPSSPASYSKSMAALPSVPVPLHIDRGSSPLSSATSPGPVADCASSADDNPPPQRPDSTCTHPSNPMAASNNGGSCAVPAVGAQSSSSSDGLSSDKNHLVILPITAYDLSTAPVHKYLVADQRAVSVPGFERPFQLARECPAYMWPHNAERLGLKRWIPRPNEPQINGAMFAVKFPAYKRVDCKNVWPAFMYHLPGVFCDKCKGQGRPCIFAHWMRMPPDEAGMPKVGSDLMHEVGPFLDACMGCWSEMDGVKTRMDQCTGAGMILGGEKKGMRFKTTVGVIQAAETAINRWLIVPSYAVRKPTTSKRGKQPPKTNTAPPDGGTVAQNGGTDAHRQAVDYIAKLLAPGQERINVLEAHQTTLEAKISTMQGEEQRMAETIISQAKELEDASETSAAKKVAHDTAITNIEGEVAALKTELESASSKQIDTSEDRDNKLAKERANSQRLEDTNRDLTGDKTRLEGENSRLKVTIDSLKLELAKLMHEKDQERLRAETAERRRDYYRGEVARLQALRVTRNAVVVEVDDDE